MTDTIKNDVLRYAVRRLNSMRDRGEDVLKKHQEKLLKDPGYEMEWADKVFKAAAEVEFARGWLLFIEEENGTDEESKLATLRNSLTREVLSKSRSIDNNSTSPSSNYMNQCRLSVMARFLEDLGLDD